MDQKSTRTLAYQRQAGFCFYCGDKMIPHSKKVRRNPKAATAEHIIPRCDGGVKVWYNIVCACKECNEFKGNIDYEIFLKIRKLENWKELSKIELWKLQGVYWTVKRRELINILTAYTNRIAI